MTNTKEQQIRDLKKRIAEMESELRKKDITDAENKRILAEAYTDEELAQMVAAGQFPADRVDEYKETRKTLALCVYYAPTIRKTTVDLIAGHKRQLAELQKEHSTRHEPTDKKQNGFYACIGIVGAFWFLLFLGPGLIMLLNNAGYAFNGAGYGEGSIMYSILVFLAQPIACGLACAAARSLSEKKHDICVLINEIIAVCFFVVLMFFHLINAELLNVANSFVSIGVCIGFAAAVALDISSRIKN